MNFYNCGSTELAVFSPTFSFQECARSRAEDEVAYAQPARLAGQAPQCQGGQERRLGEREPHGARFRWQSDEEAEGEPAEVEEGLLLWLVSSFLSLLPFFLILLVDAMTREGVLVTAVRD